MGYAEKKKKKIYIYIYIVQKLHDLLVIYKRKSLRRIIQLAIKYK